MKRDKILRNIPYAIKVSFHPTDEFTNQDHQNMHKQPIPGITFGTDEFNAIKPGDIFDTGVTETKDIHIVPARWVAYKNHDGSWTIRFHHTKHTTQFIKHNGALCTKVAVIRDLVPCTDEIFAKYRFI